MSWGNPTSFGEKALVRLLWPASFGLGTATFARMVAYNKGVLRQEQFPALIISIGNITVGGTGKTPVTIDLAQRLVANGRKVAVLSRGYKRKSKSSLVVVSDGQNVLASSLEAGDEPYLIANSVPKAAVIVGAKRVETAKLATERFGCDTIILDDAFQHFAIARDRDVVLLDYNDDLENDHLLPAGRLREPLGALARADWVVITKLPEQPNEERLLKIRNLVGKYAPAAKLSACRMVPNAITPFGVPDVTLGSATMRNTKVFAFCGIARPDMFFEELRSMGANIVGKKSFGDHHWYTHQDIAALQREYQAAGAEMVITTEKDSVKLLPALVKDLPLAVLQQRLDWLGPIPVLSNLVRESQRV